MGLVVHKQGQGTFVKAVDPKEETAISKMMQIQDATIDDLLEVRLGLSVMLQPLLQNGPMGMISRPWITPWRR